MMTNTEIFTSAGEKVKDLEKLINQLSNTGKVTNKINAVKFDISALKQGLQQLQEAVKEQLDESVKQEPQEG